MNTPSLRFKEFSDEWEEKKLGEIGDLKTSSVDKLIRENENIVNLVNYMDVYKHKSINSSNVNKLMRVSAKENQILGNSLKRGDILFTPSSETPDDIGHSIVIFEDLPNTLYSYHLIRFRPVEKMDIGYEHYFCNHLKVLKQLSKFATGATRYTISIKDFEKVKINIPSIQEQNKIAAFLSLVDKRIELQEEKINKLELYKKGLMQKIFNQEIRFKDDSENNYPEWEEKELGEIGFFKTSSVDKLIRGNENIVNLVNYMDVYKHKSINSSNVDNLMRVSAKENQILGNSLKRGDILFTPSSETPDDIGHSIVIFEDLPNTLYSYHLIRFRPVEKMDIGYEHYFCNHLKVLKQLSKFATGATRYTISIKDFEKVKINIPVIQEQRKISSLLSLLDLKTQKEQLKHQQLNNLKKGLLQQIFV